MHCIIRQANKSTQICKKEAAQQDCLFCGKAAKDRLAAQAPNE